METPAKRWCREGLVCPGQWRNLWRGGMRGRRRRGYLGPGGAGRAYLTGFDSGRAGTSAGERSDRRLPATRLRGCWALQAGGATRRQQDIRKGVSAAAQYPDRDDVWLLRFARGRVFGALLGGLARGYQG